MGDGVEHADAEVDLAGREVDLLGELEGFLVELLEFGLGER